MSGKIFEKELRRCKFGIELELCSCILGYSKGRDCISFQKYFAADLQSKMNSSKSVSKEQVDYIEDEEKTPLDYTHWSVVEDTSLGCNTGTEDTPDSYKYHKYKLERARTSGLENDKLLGDCGQEFCALELVSRVLRFTELDVLHNVYKLLFDARTIYEVNDSQGLHITVSHPNLDPEQLIELWVYYEEAIRELLLKEERRSKESTKYAMPIRDVFVSGKSEHGITRGVVGIRDWKKWYYTEPTKTGKYSAMNIKRVPGQKEYMAEFRIAGSTLQWEEIYGWIELFCRMVTLSVINQNPNRRLGNLLSQLHSSFLSDAMAGIVMKGFPKDADVK